MSFALKLVPCSRCAEAAGVCTATGAAAGARRSWKRNCQFSGMLGLSSVIVSPDRSCARLPLPTDLELTKVPLVLKSYSQTSTSSSELTILQC